MSIARIAALAGLLFFSTITSAATSRCDNCSESAYESKAISLGVGIHYVYDLQKARARKYEVQRECSGNLNDGRTTCMKAAYPMPTEPEVMDFVLELTAYYQVTGGTMKSHFTIVADGTAQNLSAFDVAGPGGPRTRLIDWFNSTQLASINNALPTLGAAIHNIAVTIASLWNDSMGQTLVTVQFQDGSTITLTHESINGTTNVVPGSAKDKYGNVIPASGADLDGARFDYSDEGPNGPARQRMLNYLEAFGISLTGSGKKWVCISIAGGAWDCAYY